MARHPRGVIGAIAEHPFGFVLTFVVLFFLLVLFMASVDALPEPAVKVVVQPSDEVVQAGVAEAPVRVVAPSIGMDVKVENPTSTEISVLDDSLLRGAVRYPTSAMLGVNGTVLLFGHSSYLPIVHNQAYKAFNEIQKLANGDIVSVYSSDKEYRFKVTAVRKADASEESVELPQDGEHLILVTCDSFAKKTDRFVVHADYVGTYSLISQ